MQRVTYPVYFTIVQPKTSLILDENNLELGLEPPHGLELGPGPPVGSPYTAIRR